MSKTGLAVSSRDYANATDIGYRWPNGTFAVVRVYLQDTPTIIVEKLHELAHAIEVVEDTGKPATPLTAKAMNTMKTGTELIAEERQRQLEKEGFDAAHDDEHGDSALVDAAACYAMGRRLPVWPWGIDWWKPGNGGKQGRIRELTKAGALIAAEIDRLQRLSPT